MHFREINTRDDPSYRAGWQRHHVYPSELRRRPQISNFIAEVVPRFDFDDFTQNGVLLPGCAGVAGATGLPLHSGPHPRYNDWVTGAIDAIANSWRFTSEQSAIFAANALRALHQRLTGNLSRRRAASIDIEDLAIFLPYPDRDRHFAMAELIAAQLK